jgi:hypothetical protein
MTAGWEGGLLDFISTKLLRKKQRYRDRYNTVNQTSSQTALKLGENETLHKSNFVSRSFSQFQIPSRQFEIRSVGEKGGAVVW